MSEDEWLESQDPSAMLAFLENIGREDSRKFRLFAAGCCRSVWSELRDIRSRAAVEAAERYVDGLASQSELRAAFIAAYAWMLEAGNRQEAEEIAMARLGTDPKQTAAAYVAFTSKPRADVTVEALQQVIDAVWDAERYTQPKGKPEKYMDLSYLARA